MNFRMLKEESTGLNYFKDREREKPKVSFELQVFLLESRGDIKSKKKIRKAAKKMSRELSFWIEQIVRFWIRTDANISGPHLY